MTCRPDAEVTIIMPSYNAANYIGSTIDSVLSQTFKAWRLLVVDDCSSDNTCEVISKYSENDVRIHLHALDKNNGAPARPRNIGVSLSDTPWVAFLDADDIWHPRKLELQLSLLKEKKSFFCSTAMKDFIDESSIIFKEVSGSNNTQVSFFHQLMKNRIPTSSVIVRRSVMLSHPFVEDLRYKAREDYECWLKIHEDVGSTVKINEPLLYYRVLEGQISGSKLKMIQKNFMVLSEYRKKDGRQLGVMKYFYFISYLFQSFYFRLIKKSL